VDLLRLDVSGPVFLALYAAFALIVIVAARNYARAGEPGERAWLEPVDGNRDPFKTAYLRGGGNELLRFAIFELVRRQALRIVATGRGRNPKPNAFEATGFAAGNGPDTLLDDIAAFCAQPRTTDEIFRSPLPRRAAAVGDERYRQGLTSEKLLASADARRRAVTATALGAVALAGLAGARLVEAALLGHRNIGFLLIETFVALGLLVALSRPPRLTARGRALLGRLRAALQPGPAITPAEAAEPLPLFVAVSGFDGLAGTTFAPMQSLFPRASSSSCGGSCGSSSGGGDSGGGGGCGGGGCGG